MSDNSANSKRIAKNTMLLYLRMMLTMAISLYTSRVVLKELGVDDYGIYNVVGGFVAMFSVLSSSLSSAISRFITFELGKGDKSELRRVFCTGINIQLTLSVVILILVETLGVWFLNNKMAIPEGRLSAANWVLQFCSLSFCVGLISVPYNAAIIAHEKMGAFAYVGILDVTLKLVIVYALSISPIDKLILYSFLLLCVSCLIRLIYGFYCRRNFEECAYKVQVDTPMFRKMAGFAGWNFLGNTAYLLNTQGVNMLVNVFFGVSVNAARGIATQVDASLRQFITSFTTAVNPQITKSYASGDLEYMRMLICRSSKLSGYLLLYFAVPIILEAHEILSLWLGLVPQFATIFLQLTITNAFFDTIFASSLVTAVMATGKIKRYQLVITICGFSVFPLTWLMYELGFPPHASYMAYGIVYALLVFVRLYLVKDLIQLQPSRYIKNVILPYIPVVFFAFAVPFGVSMLMTESVIRLLTVCVTSVICTSITAYFIGLTDNERAFVNEKIIKRVIKK